MKKTTIYQFEDLQTRVKSGLLLHEEGKEKKKKVNCENR